MTDERIRALERSVANAPADATERLALARELARVGRRADARVHVARVLRAEPLSADAVRALHELGFGPLAHDAPWPTVEGGNDRARRSAHPGARRGELVKRIRIGKDSERPLTLTVSATTVHVATNLGRLVALALPSGEPRWVRQFDQDVGAPAIGEGERLVVGGNGAIHLLSPEDGRTLWVTALPGRSNDRPIHATFGPRGLVLAHSEGVLHACDTLDGRVRWSRPASSDAAVGADTIYSVEESGDVSCLDPAGTVRARARVPRGANEVRLAGSELWVASGQPPRAKLWVLALSAGGDVTSARPAPRFTGLLGWGCVLGPDRIVFPGDPGELLAGESGEALDARIVSAVADSASCFFAVHPGGVGWFDGSGKLVKNVLPGANDVGPYAIGPDSTLLVASPRNILHVIA